MRPIPKSRIQENLYTNGTGIGKNITLRFVSSKIPYIGFYNVVNGSKYSTGKTFTETSKLLEKYNLLATAFAVVATAGSIATTANSLLKKSTTTSGTNLRYFYKDLGTTDIKIKEIDQKAYNQLANQPSSNYQVISFDSTTQTIDEVNQQMPGLKAFLAS
jgi:hypothetical protein